MTELRLADRAVSAAAGAAVGALLVTLVVASFVVTPRPAATPVVAALDPVRAAPVARGEARLRDATAGETLDDTTVVMTSAADVEASAAPALEPAPDPTPAPTPEPTAAPTRAPTPRPTIAPAAIAPVATTTTREAELRMLALMNASRLSGGLAPLALDEGVSAVARAHSQVESQVLYVYHDGPDGTARVRDSAACGSGWYGENTGKVWQGNVDRLHIEFMSEPWVPINHRTNIMDASFRRVGVGAVQGPDALYMTMVFCR